MSEIHDPSLALTDSPPVSGNGVSRRAFLSGAAAVSLALPSAAGSNHKGKASPPSSRRQPQSALHLQTPSILLLFRSPATEAGERSCSTRIFGLECAPVRRRAQ